MTKYAHIASNFLLESTQPGQRIIKTSIGDFRIRKNGKTILVIDQGKEYEEMLRVVPIKSKKPAFSGFTGGINSLKIPKRNQEVVKFMASIGNGVEKALNATITDQGYLQKRKGYTTFGEMVDVLWNINKQNKKTGFTSEYTVILPLKGTKPIYKKTLRNKNAQPFS